jgi:hypothetical protein
MKEYEKGGLASGGINRRMTDNYASRLNRT